MLTLQLNRLSPLVRNGYKSYIAPVASMRSWELTVASNDLFSDYARNYEARRQTEMTLEDYLRGCRGDPMMYASAPERLLAAIGEPEIH